MTTLIAHDVAIHSVKGKARYTVYHPARTGVVVGTRLCEDHRYHYAVVAVSKADPDKAAVNSMHGRLDLAQAAKVNYDGMRWHNEHNFHIVVPMQLEVLVPVKTSAKDKNATRRGTITRKIAQREKSVVHYNERLATLLADGVDPRQVGYWGEAKAAEHHARYVAESRSNLVFLANEIAKLEAERDALLLATGEV
jgi:hypothetical protein